MPIDFAEDRAGGQAGGLVYGIDVLACTACGGRMRVIAFLEDPQVVRGILLHLGLPADPPPMGRAWDPPRQTSFE